MAPSKYPKPPAVPENGQWKEVTDFSLSVEDRVKATPRAVLSNPQWDPIHSQGFDVVLCRDLLHYVSYTATPTPRTVWCLTIPSAYCNGTGSLHGAAATLILDICTTTALMVVAKAGYWANWGVSRNLNVTFLRAAPMGEEILVECEAVSVGKRAAHLKGVIKLARNGEICAVCTHDKLSMETGRM